MMVTCLYVSRCPPCFGSSKQPKTEQMWKPALSRGPLWKNVHFIECNPNGEVITGPTGKPLCQELMISLADPGGKLDYMPTDQGRVAPLTLAACHPDWDDYLDLTETVTEMAHCLMKEDGQEVATPPKASTTPKKKEATQGIAIPPNEGITWVPASEFPRWAHRSSSL